MPFTMRRLTLSNSWTQRVSTGRNCSNGENFRKKKTHHRMASVLFCSVSEICVWCPRLDSNQHASRRCDLNTVRLPISPLGHKFSETRIITKQNKNVKRFSKKFLRAIFRRNCLLKRLVDRLCAATDRSVQIVGIVLSEFRHFSSGMMRLIRGRREGCCRCVCRFVAN